MKKRLFLFTSEFPYGSTERYLESEIEYLSKGFDQVCIYSTYPNNIITRKVPGNCFPERVNLNMNGWKKLMALFYLFHPIVWEELRITRKVYHLPITRSRIATMLISLYRSQKIAKLVSKISKSESSSSELYFYSYWCDDSALGISRAQQKHPNIVTVCRIHRWDVYFEESKINYLPYRHFIVDHIKAIYSISQDAREYCIKNWKPLSKENISVSPLGVTKKPLPLQPENSPFVLVSCSNMIPVKRIDLIIKSLSTITDLPIKWHHFGGGDEYNDLKELAALHLPSNIECHFSGDVSNKSLMEWYASNYCDLFINLSSSEGIPVSIMEAMSFGIPVFATNVGGTSEIVNIRNGRLLGSNPLPGEVAIELKNFIQLSEIEKKKFRETAFATWDEKFNAEVNYTRFIQEILQLKTKI